MSSPSEPGLRLGATISEGARIAVAMPVASVVAALIVAAVCGLILATTGQTVRAEQEVLARIDEAGTRLVVAIDERGQAIIDPSAVERVGRLTGVEWAFGLGFAADARSSTFGRAGAPAAVRTFWGELPVMEVNGRLPRPGEALVGVESLEVLGLRVPVGSIDVEEVQLAVVGSFTADDPLGFLDTSVLAAPNPDNAGDARLRSIHVLADTPGEVASVARAVAAVLGAADPTGVRFETSAALAEVRTAVAGELGRFGRQLVLGALGAGLILVSLVVYASVTLRRSDFGRRRALGASRGAVVGLVASQYVLVAVAGAILGCVTGSVIAARLAGGPPGFEFIGAVAVLAVLTTLVASLPPALVAAYRDPVRVLRVP